MGYAGQPMKVVKANRALLRKRSFKDIKKLYAASTSTTELSFNEISIEELAHIKDQIRAKAKKEAKQEIAIYCICIILTLGFFYWLFYL